MTTRTVSDVDRIDPANATRWHVRAEGRNATVVATCRADARLLGLARIAELRGDRWIRTKTYTRVTPADETTAAKWLDERQRQAAMLSRRRKVRS